MTDARRVRVSAHAGRARAVAGVALATLVAVAPFVAADPLPRFAVEGDGIVQPLSARPGDAARGRALLVARGSANCVLCHAVPDPDVRFPGNVGPSLAGVGARLAPAQLRLRVADPLRVNPSSVMPSYYRVDGLVGVAAEFEGKPILSAAEVEDVVAYLATLK